MCRLKKNRLMIIMFFLFLCSCTSNVTNDDFLETKDPIIEQQKEIPFDSAQYEEQYKILWKDFDMWTCKTKKEDIFDYSDYQYAITDLNYNGRLEAIVAICVGSGKFTSFSIYEINEEENGMNEKIDMFLDEFHSVPDIIEPMWKGKYDDTTHQYSYYLDDFEGFGVGIGNLQKYEMIVAEDIELVSRYMNRVIVDDEGQIVSDYFNDKHERISEEEYNHMEQNIENSCNISYKLNWKCLSDLSGKTEEEMIQEFKNAMH